MKKTKRFIAMLLLGLMVCFVFVGCQQDPIEQPLISASDATDTSEQSVISDGNSTKNTADNYTELGEGALAITVDVIGPDASTDTFLVYTDADNLADALLGVALVEGDNGAYGLYIKTVNGIRADYDLDGAYWSLQSNGEMLMTGANDTSVTDGAKYELVYTAG